MMSSMDEDELTPEEFDRRLEMGRRVDLQVLVSRRPVPLYTVAVTHGGGFNGAATRPTPTLVHTSAEQQLATRP